MEHEMASSGAMKRLAERLSLFEQQRAQMVDQRCPHRDQTLARPMQSLNIGLGFGLERTVWSAASQLWQSLRHPGHRSSATSCRGPHIPAT
jgi:hypothetical protein